MTSDVALTISYKLARFFALILKYIGYFVDRKTADFRPMAYVSVRCIIADVIVADRLASVVPR